MRNSLYMQMVELPSVQPELADHHRGDSSQKGGKNVLVSTDQTPTNLNARYIHQNMLFQSTQQPYTTTAALPANFKSKSSNSRLKARQQAT